MTKEEMVLMIRDNVSDKNSDIFPNDQIDRAVWRAWDQIVMVFSAIDRYWGIQKKTVIFNADNPDTSTLGLSPKILKWLYASFKGCRIPIKEIFEAQQSAEISLYHYNGSLRWYSEIISTDFEVILTYAIGPLGDNFEGAENNLAQLFDLPIKYHTLVVDLATVLLLSRDEDKSDAQFWQGIYQANLQTALVQERTIYNVEDVQNAGY